MEYTAMKNNQNKTDEWILVDGIVVAGYGVASGRAKNSPYPRGSISMQSPFFLDRGVDIRHCYQGTINIDIQPCRFQMVNPEWTLVDVAWFDGLHETFSFSRCVVIYKKEYTEGFVYYPHPETKPAHFQNESTIEILAPFIRNIGEGCRVGLSLIKHAIRIYK